MKHINNPDNKPSYNPPPKSKPYMGDLTSAQIGQMASAGKLGGEMVRRMINAQEEQLIEKYNSNKLQ